MHMRLSKVLQKLVKIRPALLGSVFLVALIILALFAPYLAPYSPRAQDLQRTFEPPSREHWAGTDDLGRDILSRVIYGSRVSVQVAVVAIVLAAVMGTALGLIAAWLQGAADVVIMRFMDALLAFPALVLALGIMAILGPSTVNAMLAIGIVRIPFFARLVRSQALSIRELPFLEAARAMGKSDAGIIVKHLLPNCVPVLIVQSTLNLGNAVLVEAALSFLGLGVQPPTPSWGGMLSDARAYIAHEPWLGLAPGLAIFFTIMSVNLVGDALRDILDPKLQGQG